MLEENSFLGKVINVGCFNSLVSIFWNPPSSINISSSFLLSSVGSELALAMELPRSNTMNSKVTHVVQRVCDAPGGSTFMLA